MQRKTSILTKISLLSSAFIFIAVLVLAVQNIFEIREACLDSAEYSVKNEIWKDIDAFKSEILDNFGQLRLQSGELLDKNGINVATRVRFIENFSKEFRCSATIFIREGDDFRRVVTSLVDNNNKHLVGTMLGTTSAAYPSVIKGESFTGRALILGNQFLTCYDPMFAPGSNTEVIGLFFTGIDTTEVHAIAKQKSNETIVKSIISVVIILVVSTALNIFLFGKIIVKPLKTILGGLQTIGKGDFSQSLEIRSRDEIGQLAEHFNLATDKIKNLLGVIKNQTLSLSDVGNTLATNMDETASAITEISANIQSIKDRINNQADSVMQTSGSMEKLTGNINQLNTYVEQQSVNVSQSSSAVEEMVANIQSVTDSLIKNSGRVKNLADTSEIGSASLQEVADDIETIARDSEGLLEVNALLENIASQTNLLSMNAAIEAAHAGEAGKGFAVVADEIRKLAELSSEQSKTISQVLKKTKGSIDKITTSTEEALKKFQDISTGVQDVTELTDGIRSAMEEQGTGSKQILSAINDLNSVMKLISTGSEDMLKSCRHVIDEGENLGGISQEISGGMEEMACGAEQINTTVHQVNEISSQNKEYITVLAEEVSRFKV